MLPSRDRLLDLAQPLSSRLNYFLHDWAREKDTPAAREATLLDSLWPYWAVQ